ncbi:hypothetical protein DSM43518_03245 [Mycobacterium marinum]|nr:hypothetical protein DSM43518_03245 [Mycobacterium marinum]
MLGWGIWVWGMLGLRVWVMGMLVGVIRTG